MYVVNMCVYIIYCMAMQEKGISSHYHVWDVPYICSSISIFALLMPWISWSFSLIGHCDPF